ISGCCSRGRASAPSRSGSSGRHGRSGRRHGSGGSPTLSCAGSRAVGLGARKDEPSGLCVRPAPMRWFRIRRGGAAVSKDEFDAVEELEDDEADEAEVEVEEDASPLDAKADAEADYYAAHADEVEEPVDS